TSGCGQESGESYTAKTTFERQLEEMAGRKI
ncbi:unnamed protein product, partial [marine sediment metagenome]